MSEPAHWEEYIIRQFTRTKLQATDMRCFRKLLGISYRDHITNDAVRDRIRQAIGPYDDILTTVKKRKLKWFGHVSRSSGLAKTILQGTVQGGRRRGRQKKRWENNIAEWTGLKFCDAVREAEHKIKWRERDATSVAPQRSLTTGYVQVQFTRKRYELFVQVSLALDVVRHQYCRRDLNDLPNLH